MYHIESCPAETQQSVTWIQPKDAQKNMRHLDEEIYIRSLGRLLE